MSNRADTLAAQRVRRAGVAATLALRRTTRLALHPAQLDRVHRVLRRARGARPADQLHQLGSAHQRQSPSAWTNYQKLFADPQFWQSLGRTLYYVVLNIPLQTVLAVGLAVLMDRLTQSIFVRGVLVLPWLIPNVVVALLWLWMLDPSLGLINQILRRLRHLAPALRRLGRAGHAGDRRRQYLATRRVYRVADLRRPADHPERVYEAGAIDGATETRMFWSITIPLLRPVLVFVLVTTVIGSFQIFDTIAIMTKGGPVNATRVIYWYIYEFAFNRFQMGYATAAAVVLFLILIAVTLLQMRFLRAGESDLA